MNVISFLQMLWSRLLTVMAIPWRLNITIPARKQNSHASFATDRIGQPKPFGPKTNNHSTFFIDLPSGQQNMIRKNILIFPLSLPRMCFCVAFNGETLSSAEPTIPRCDFFAFTPCVTVRNQCFYFSRHAKLSLKFLQENLDIALCRAQKELFQNHGPFSNVFHTQLYDTDIIRPLFPGNASSHLSLLSVLFSLRLRKANPIKKLSCSVVNWQRLQCYCFLGFISQHGTSIQLYS